MEDKREVLKGFCRKFYVEVRKRERDAENLGNDIIKISSLFKPSLKEDKSFESALEEILEKKPKEEIKPSSQWFGFLVGKLKDSSIKFHVSQIKESFKRDLLSSLRLSFSSDELDYNFKKFLNWNEKDMEELVNKISKECSEGKNYSEINLMLGVKRDLVGPYKIMPELFFSYYSLFFSAKLLYSTAKTNFSPPTASIEIYSYYPTNHNLKFFTQILNSREIVEEFVYDWPLLLNFFLFSNEIESYLRKMRKRNKF